MTRSKLGPFAAPLALATIFLAPFAARAVPVTTQSGPNVPCAVLEETSGNVMVLDATRTNLIEAEKKSTIPCGGWVSVKEGFALVRHREGHRIHVGTHSFVEVSEYMQDGKNSGDHVLLYKGQAYGQSEHGNGELRMITAGARARIKDASAILIYNHEEEDSQLVVLTSSATFENRFETSRRIEAKPGEATSMNFRHLRIVPSAPKAVTLTSLRPKMVELHLGDAVQERALAAALERANRKFADGGPGSQESKKTVQAINVETRAPASVVEKKVSYERHDNSEKNDPATRSHWVNKLVGGDKQLGERILFPDKNYGRPQTAQVEVKDADELIDEKWRKKRQKEDDAEKRRLMHELAQIREN